MKDAASCLVKVEDRNGGGGGLPLLSLATDALMVGKRC